jgi:hypothetical protein
MWINISRQSFHYASTIILKIGAIIVINFVIGLSVTLAAISVGGLILILLLIVAGKIKV